MNGRYHTLFILEIYNKFVYRLNVYANRQREVMNL